LLQSLPAHYTSAVKYTPEAAAQIEQAFHLVDRGLSDAVLPLENDVAPQLRTKRAKEFLLQGVARRIKIIRRSVQNLFRIFPVERSQRLKEGELGDMQINLHAFLINVHGIPDNLAWVYLLERNIEIHPKRIGLFNARHTQPHLPAEVRDYLYSTHLQNWHGEYAKNYRDALVHRIPPFLASRVLTEDDEEKGGWIEEQITEATEVGDFDKARALRVELNELGSVCLVIAHSLLDEEAKPPVLLHSALIVDARTVLEIISKVQPHLALPTPA